MAVADAGFLKGGPQTKSIDRLWDGYLATPGETSNWLETEYIILTKDFQYSKLLSKSMVLNRVF